jgi:hypothetical protein
MLNSGHMIENPRKSITDPFKRVQKIRRQGRRAKSLGIQEPLSMALSKTEIFGEFVHLKYDS